ncbi:MAG: glycosyltransferase [Pseudomonadota bacterium]
MNFLSHNNIVLHDYFEAAEGGGRLSLTLARSLPADLAYGFRGVDHPFFTLDAFPGRIHQVSSCSHIPIWRQLKLIHHFSNRTGFLADYRFAVYSGFYAPLAVHNSGGVNICYCHTPPRFLYDQHDYFMSLISPWHRPVLGAFNSYFRPRYERAMNEMDRIVANSTNVQKRIRKYLGLESQVVYPPCDTSRFCWQGQDDFYLSTARLDPLKRVDVVVRAFLRMPDKNLVVVSGGCELARIRRLAGNAKNIKVMGWVSETQLRALVGRCISTVYLPMDEDFGMSPVESMAAGKPVIGVAEGGLLESMIPGETGVLLRPDFNEELLCREVREMTPARALAMRTACERRARVFNKEIFVQKMREMAA